MSRPLRIELPNGLYHVTSRGDRCEPIFEDDVDRERFLDVLGEGLHRFDASVCAYCLMGNHYHFVLQTRQANLSRLMRHVNGVYSQAYNRRHGLAGHLFQGRFKAIHVDRETYFLAVCRYVELNPVRAAIVRDVADWKWSSFRAYTGMARIPLWLEWRALLGVILGRDIESCEDVTQARAMYSPWVRDGLADRLWDRGLHQEIYLGEGAFIEHIQASMRPSQATSKEIPAAQSSRPKPSDARFADRSREREMFRVHVESGRTLASIADEWNLSVSRVSRLIKRARCEANGSSSERTLDSVGRCGGKT